MPVTSESELLKNHHKDQGKNGLVGQGACHAGPVT